MAYHSRRDGLSIEVDKGVAAYHHGIVAGAELTDNPLDHSGGIVEVVGVELDGEASAAWVEQGLVPATAYSEVFRTLRLEQYEAGVSDIFKKLAGAVV